MEGDRLSGSSFGLSHAFLLVAECRNGGGCKELTVHKDHHLGPLAPELIVSCNFSA